MDNANYYVIIIDNIHELKTRVSICNAMEQAIDTFCRAKDDFLENCEDSGIELNITVDSDYEFCCDDGEDEFNLVIARSL